MSVILKIVLVIQMLSALTMIGLILIQHGKGADMGAAFGSGGSGSLFGASGSANFMSRATAVLAAVFFVATLTLSYFGNLRSTESGSVLERAAVTTPATAPAAASPAAQIPGNSPATPVALPGNMQTPSSSAATSAVPTTAGTGSQGAAQIPTK